MPVCLYISIFVTNNVFAEPSVTDVVCKSLVATAETNGEWSPAVTVCAGKANDGTVVLLSLGQSDNYYSNGAAVKGVSKEAKIDVNDSANPKRGVILRGNSGSGSIQVGGLGWGQDTLGGTYTAKNLSSPDAFVNAVMTASKDTIGSNSLYSETWTDTAPWETISGVPTCFYSYDAQNADCLGNDFSAYENQIKAQGYDPSQCVWADTGNDTTYGKSYVLQCGGRTERVRNNYKIEVKTESDDVAKAAANNATTGNTAGGTTEGQGEDEVKNTCMNSGGSGTLGWIVCSITEWLGKAANGAYEEFVEPSLQVDPQLFEGGDDGTRGGWETFRNIANIVFIIFFLFVIFSQLTGVGIDNYGIKKIMPKLIVAAILINLSYWICLVFVDLSNILGNSFQALFDGLGTQLGAPELQIEGATTVGEIPTGAIASVGVLGALVIMTGTVWANPAVVLSLLVAALGVAISIFFLFILLAARQAAIIILTVLSPLAVVCYMLPNTKSLFDKWLKLFEALLLVYPICGLLIGGGNYVSRLLLSAGFAAGSGIPGFFKALTAMIVGIVPIFFIPSVLKSSFSAMGSLGAKISGIGQKMSGTATGAARNSQGYKSLQERGMARRTRIAAGLNRHGEETGVSRKVGRVVNFGRGGKNAMASNRAQYLKNQDALIRADALDGVGYKAARAEQLKKAGSDQLAAETALLADEYANVSDEQLKADWKEAFKENKSNLGALTNVLAGRFGPGAANTIGNTLAETTLKDSNGNINKKALGSIQQLQGAMAQNSTLAGQMANKAPDANRMISAGGVTGRGENGEAQYGNLSDFPATYVTTDTDWASVGSGALERALNSGQLSADQAERILNSDVQSVQTALDDDKRNILKAGIYKQRNNAQDVSIGPNLPVKEAANRYENELRIDHGNSQNRA